MTIANIKEWFEQAVPEPTDKNRAVQIGCHFEEVGEMADAILPGSQLGVDLHNLANHLKAGAQSPEQVENAKGAFARMDRAEFLDALCDQIVTAVGVAHMFNLDIIGALAEVNRSNWSKFVDGKPVFDANGKIAKPATYSPPDLSKFV